MTEHTLATTAQFRDWLATTSYSSSWSSDAATIRRLLEQSTREIVAYAGDAGSFGPILATLDFDIGSGVLLDDPRPVAWNGTRASRSLFPWIISVTSATRYSDTARDSSQSLTLNTDYYLTPYETLGFKAPYLGIKYRDTSSNNDPFDTTGQKTLAIVGEFGWQDVKVADTTLSGAVSGTTTKTITTADAANLSAAQTIIVNSERMYIESISSNTLTVERGVAGTTATTHGDGDQIYFYTYPPAVTQACLDLTRISWTDRAGGLQDEVTIAGNAYSMPSMERSMVLHTIDSYATHGVNQGIAF